MKPSNCISRTLRISGRALNGVGKSQTRRCAHKKTDCGLKWDRSSVFRFKVEPVERKFIPHPGWLPGLITGVRSEQRIPFRTRF